MAYLVVTAISIAAIIYLYLLFYYFKKGHDMGYFAKVEELIKKEWED